MKIIRAKDYKDMSRKAANIISAQVIMKPNCVLGLATGGTPVGAYAQLVEWYNGGRRKGVIHSVINRISVAISA